MSIELNWETLTAGPDGEALAGQIRDFIHTKFQDVPLPRFIKSVTVHDFAFGSIPPRVVLKDICDPLPDFYEDDYEDDEEDDEEEEEEEEEEDDGEQGKGYAEDKIPDAIRRAEQRRRADLGRRLDGLPSAGGRNSRPSSSGARPHHPTLEGPFPPHIGLRSAPGTPADLGSPYLAGSGGGGGLGVPGGTANIHYFQSKLAGGPWSGTQTPLAAVAGAQHLGWGGGGSPSADTGPSSPQSPLDGHSPRAAAFDYVGHSRHSSENLNLAAQHPLREKHSVSTMGANSAGASSRPPTRDALSSALDGAAATSSSYYSNSSATAVNDDDDEGEEGEEETAGGKSKTKTKKEPSVDDLQAVFRIRYAGDVRLELTAEILLDYPMPSFVGIPVKLNISGLTFDGVGVVAHIRGRVHFCFLSPEDALAAVGADDAGGEEEDGAEEESGSRKAGAGRLGGLLQEIRVESEIGLREGSKQSLKNVGKVEKFVLEQVRRIFEEEFVYPSFWTFLV
ncbi:hypothetical protein F4780DRAFT_20926 [Xylariomycetidae sp. FL0641]|nr:hypothetical protein F4780DRAFT_20926 [Xylariomycetidae sp. FL0641]